MGIKRLTIGTPWLLVLFSIVGCDVRSQESPDLNSVMACMARQQGHDDFIVVTRCEPLGPERHFSGTWFAGFEVSSFRMGYDSVPAELGRPAKLHRLVVEKELNTQIHSKDYAGVAAYQVEFYGRASLLSRTDLPGTIVLDRLIRIRQVPRAQITATERSIRN